ncbi:MAG TPA: type II toxin-antitoxin system RelE/ParE family toxin [Candidatus Acidoferrum sp.]|nr:type II toxin-antitoxin system RelE/ParE family toxin [Candidatus Acidoferrum sp.]
MHLRWTEQATRDLTDISDYIQERSNREVARRVALSIWESTDVLPEFPNLGRAGRKSGTRELVMKDLPYLAIYRIKGEAIEVLRILHGAQRWP